MELVLAENEQLRAAQLDNLQRAGRDPASVSSPLNEGAPFRHICLSFYRFHGHFVFFGRADERNEREGRDPNGRKCTNG